MSGMEDMSHPAAIGEVQRGTTVWINPCNHLTALIVIEDESLVPYSCSCNLLGGDALKILKISSRNANFVHSHFP